MKFIYRAQFILHIIIGLGAMAGGTAAITNPASPMGMPVEVLHGYFESFLIPGLFLFFVLGLGNLVCAMLFRVKAPIQGYSSGLIGAVMVIWIIVQCLILRDVVALHVIFCAFGLVQGALALVMLGEKRLFPLNIILNIYDKIKA